MAKLHRVGPEEVEALLLAGHRYIDVRTAAEFAEGHIPGSSNVPIFFEVGGARVLNEDFAELVMSLFSPADKLILGCRAGVRSLRAAEVLRDAGFEELWELRTGWDGARDAFGRLEPGWSRKGLPVATGQPVGFCYADLQRQARPAFGGSTLEERSLKAQKQRPR